VYAEGLAMGDAPRNEAIARAHRAIDALAGGRIAQAA
jgi:FMN-dependent NADH-azoreductase